VIRGQYWRSVVKLFIVGPLCVGIGGAAFLADHGNIWRAYRPGGTFYDTRHAWSAYLLPFLLYGIILAGVGALVWGVCLILRPRWHPVLRRLAAFGPPEEVAASIDRELADTAEVLRIGEPRRSFRLAMTLIPPVVVTRSWLVQGTEFGLRLVRLEDIVWVQRVIFTPPLTVIDDQASFFHGVAVMVREGKDERFILSETDTHRLLVALLTRLPWVLSGFDPGREQQWRAGAEPLWNAVQQERQQIQALSPDARRSLIDDKVRLAASQVRDIRTHKSEPKA